MMVSRNVPNNCMNTVLQQLKGSILKATLSKSFLVPLDLKHCYVQELSYETGKENNL
jgi:hypothetical protein